MSKRYGRNQKREARERIAALEGAIQMDRDLLAYQSEKLHQYEYWARELDRLVPRYSILKKDVQTRTQTNAPRPTEYLAEMRPLPPLASDIAYELYDTPMRRIEMNVMEIESRRDDFNRGLRYQIKLNNQDDARVFYAVDDEAMRITGIDRHEVEWMSREIARTMMGHVNERYRR